MIVFLDDDYPYESPLLPEHTDVHTLGRCALMPIELESSFDLVKRRSSVRCSQIIGSYLKYELIDYV